MYGLDPRFHTRVCRSASRVWCRSASRVWCRSASRVWCRSASRGSHLPRVAVPLSRVLLLVLGLVWHRRCQQVHPTFLYSVLGSGQVANLVSPWRASRRTGDLAVVLVEMFCFVHGVFQRVELGWRCPVDVRRGWFRWGGNFPQDAALSLALPGGTNIHKPCPPSSLDDGWLFFREASYGFLAVETSFFVGDS